MSKLTVVMFLILISSILDFTNSRAHEGQIDLEDVAPANYDYLHPPLYYLSEPLQVNITVDKLTIRSIDDSDMTLSVSMEMFQAWVDQRLTYPIWALRNTTVLDSSWTNKLWNPKLYFVNSVDGKLDSVISPTSFFWLTRDNILYFYCRVILKLICEMNLKEFPHDEQQCKIQMGSAIYTTKDVYLTWSNNSREIQLFSLQQFKITALKKSSFLKPLGPSQVSCLELIIYLRRQTGYYMINVYIPTILIVAMSMLTFWIPHDAIPARITLGVTSLLTIITKQYQASMPSVSYIVALNIWLSCCIAFVFLTLLEYAVIISVMSKLKKSETVRRSIEPILPLVTLQMNRTWSVKRKWSQENPNLIPKRIDFISRFLFPILFFIFCLAYWSCYG